MNTMFTTMNFTTMNFIMLFIISGSNAFLQEIKTGEVGIKFVRGQLQDYILQPDWHGYIPYYSEVVPINVQQDVDWFGNIACGSSDGNDLIFHDVRVTNEPSHDPKHILDMVTRFTTNYEKLLIENIIHKVIYETCSTMTQDEIYRTKFDGIDERIKKELTAFQERFNTHLKIIDVSLKKPEIHNEFKKLYDIKTMEESKIKNQKKIQERILQQKLTQKMEEEQDALREKTVSQIKKEQIKMEAEAEKAIQSINDAKQAETIKTAADAEAYKLRTIAAAEKERHTPEYLELEYTRNVVAKADAYYGTDLPKFVMQSRTRGKNTENLQQRLMEDL